MNIFGSKNVVYLSEKKSKPISPIPMFIPFSSFLLQERLIPKHFFTTLKCLKKYYRGPLEALIPFFNTTFKAVSSLQCHYEETVHCLLISPQDVLVFIWSTWEGWNAKSKLGPTSGFEPRIPRLEIQRPNHETTGIKAKEV